MLSRALAALLALLALAAPAAARGESAAQLTDEARQQYAAQEYERVIALLAPLAADPRATPAQKIDAYELIGLSQLILGDAAQARAAFEKLLALDPQHELRDPSGSPKLQSFFDGVKQSFAASARPRLRLEHRPPQPPLALQDAGGRRRARPAPIYRRWWFWTAIGAAVIGGSVAVIFAAREQAPAGNLEPGILQLPLR